jgi:gas vesicle protein
MSENEGGAEFAYLLAGLGVGAILGLLAAPRSGQEIRERLRQRANEGRDCAKDVVRQVRQRAEELVTQGSQVLAEQRELLSEAIDAGRQTYWREKLKDS